MRSLLRPACCLVLLLAACRSAPEKPPTGPFQTETDERLRYELLEPASHEFRVTYELAATTPGARTYFTPVRGDTFVSEVKALDLFTGAKLDVGLVGGADARKNGHPAADPQGSYFAVRLDRPVPEHGEVRLHLEVKYEDRTSYEFQSRPNGGDEIAFQRLLAVNDVGVTLPADYALVDCNQSARIEQLGDGRLSLAYTKSGHAPVPLRIRARKVTWSAPGDAVEREGGMGFNAPWYDGAPDARGGGPTPPSHWNESQSQRLHLADCASVSARSTASELHALAPHATRIELCDVDAGTLALEHEFDLADPATTQLFATCWGKPEDAATFDVDTGARLPLRAGSPTSPDLASLAGKPSARLRLEVRVTLGPLPREHTNRLAWTSSTGVPTVVVLPASWSLLACSAPASVAPMPDSGQRIVIAPADARGFTVAVARVEPAAKRGEPETTAAPRRDAQDRAVKPVDDP